MISSSSLLARSSALRLGVLFSILISISSVAAQPVNIRLPAHAQGPAAVAALSSHLPDVARAYGLEPQALATLFQVHPSLGVDRNGALLYLCAGLAIDSADPLLVQDGDSGSVTLAAAASPSSTTDAFKLHSLPGATRVIYLDFDGHVTTGTWWNSSFTNDAPIVSAPFTLDSDASTFSTTERDFIRRVWRRVAEDFAPFNVNVTTEEPGEEALRRTDASDVRYGMRVVISPTVFYSTTAGGVAYLRTFTANTDTPCFVFTSHLGNGEKTIAECSSHETGHTLGLHHDGLGGSTPTEYYKGHGSWAPIMGNSYSRAISQWSRGEYGNANNAEDDFALMQTYGVSLMPDDHGNTLATASLLGGPSVADGGTIETRADVDVFRFETGAGTISLNISGDTLSPNLDLKAELLNASGQVLQTSDSVTSLNASISATVSAGTYYLRIDGVGAGDPVSTGYSDYASVGNYVITGTLISTGTKQAPVAVASASVTSGPAPLTVGFSAAGSGDADGAIASYRWDFGDGATSTAFAPVYTYYAQGTFVAVLTVTDNDGLAGTSSVTLNVGAPANQPPVAVAGAAPNSGVAPLPVAFSSAGSLDPEGGSVSYHWSFGDGTSSTAAAPAKTYGSPGTYIARLTVKDTLGATSSADVVVTVLADPSRDVDVHGFSLAGSVPAKNGTSAIADVLVLDRLGRPAAGVAVAIQWSGLVSGATTAVSGSDGRVQLTSSRTKKSGTITATISNVAPPSGTTYDPTIVDVPLTCSIRL